MKVVIVGGTSSVGTALKPVLSQFAEVITAGRRNCDIHLDLNDPLDKIVLPENVDTVIHTAAGFGGTTEKEIQETKNVNVSGTLKICEAAVKANAKHLVLISSIFVLMKEDNKQYGIYSITKKHSEEIARLFCSTHKLPLTILRPSQIYGNGESFRKHQPFFYSMIDKAEKGEDISLYGSHDPLRNYIHIEDLTNIISKVVENKIEGTYSCTQTKDVSYSQIAQAAFDAFKTKGTINFLKDKADIPDNIFEKDISLYEKTGIYPQISVEEGIKKIADSKKANS